MQHFALWEEFPEGGTSETRIPRAAPDTETWFKQSGCPEDTTWHLPFTPHLHISTAKRGLIAQPNVNVWAWGKGNFFSALSSRSCWKCGQKAQRSAGRQIQWDKHSALSCKGNCRGQTSQLAGTSEGQTHHIPICLAGSGPQWSQTLRESSEPRLN